MLLTPFLIAQHCFVRFGKTEDPSNIQVRIGDHNLNAMGDTPIEKTVNVTKMYHHPDYPRDKPIGPWGFLKIFDNCFLIVDSLDY